MNRRYCERGHVAGVIAGVGTGAIIVSWGMNLIATMHIKIGEDLRGRLGGGELLATSASTCAHVHSYVGMQRGGMHVRAQAPLRATCA